MKKKEEEEGSTNSNSKLLLLYRGCIGMLFLVEREGERESKRRITRGNIIASRLRAYFLCVCVRIYLA